MSHIIFFSYARADLDRYLEDFFKDLCIEVANSTNWGPDDDNVSFRDQKNLRVMENWKTHIEGALQSSTVLVGITSVKYLNSEFCGKEYYVFDQRRRQGLAPKKDPPPTFLPVVWLPVSEDLPEFMNDVHQLPKEISALYLKKGLRHLRRFEHEMYDKCVAAFAEAIISAWKEHDNIVPLGKVEDFSNIPNAFEDGQWEEAAEPGGWKRGPEVANFIFIAEHAPAPRYGEMPSEWRPYLPPEMTTILEYAQQVKKKQFLFREIRGNLSAELESAKDRLNLSIVIGSHTALVLDSFAEVRTIEKLWWEGTALLVPCDDNSVDEHKLRNLLTQAFPVLSTAQKIIGPIRSSADLLATLEATLSKMRSAIKKPEKEKKPPTGDAPSTVSGAP